MAKYNYPAPDSQRSGSKVSWFCYRSQADAKAASKIAEREGAELERLGYDFGFMAPGKVSELLDQSGLLYEVCIP